MEYSHQKGIVNGVFGWPAIHTRKSGKEEVPKLDNIFIDIGAKNKKKLKKWTYMWDVSSLILTASISSTKQICLSYIDNRAGGFMIAEVGRLLHENKVKLPFGLYITNAVQEEVGLRGLR